ncbi:hypothetical protein KM043_017951 [Ampulex compressa]|nr:hypothetical protein KM043_017951 [Ampulex compressa]
MIDLDLCLKMQERPGFRLIKEKKDRSIYVQLPHTIHDKKQVEDLFFGNFEVRLTRQASRHCHVVFSSLDEKIRNLAAIRNKTINGKRIIAHNACAPKFEKESTKVKKKIVIPQVNTDSKITQTLFLSNIKCGTRIQEIKQALKGCTSVKLLPPYTQHLRSAIAKMESIQIAADYLTKKLEAPTIREHKLEFKCDTRVKHKKQKHNASTSKAHQKETKTSRHKKKKLLPNTIKTD